MRSEEKRIVSFSYWRDEICRSIGWRGWCEFSGDDCKPENCEAWKTNTEPIRKESKSSEKWQKKARDFELAWARRGRM